MKYALLLLLAYSIPLISFSQGCSDAGFCTMGAMKPDQPYSKKVAVKLKSAEISFYRGTTTLTPVIFVATVDLNFSIKGRNTFQVKLPYQAVTGTLGDTQGLSDISLCFTRNIVNKDAFSLNLSFGTKIPTNHSDKWTPSTETPGRRWPLPMYYQTSLGTYDIISGISFINRKWLLATGIQIPLNANGNNFTWSAWADAKPDLKAYADRYPQAMDLRRGTDVMLRVERNFRFAKFNFTAGLLPIYRITRDVFKRSGTEANSAITEVSPEQTKGLALSAILTTGYSFNARSGVRLLLGHKIVNREPFNPDGLTREFVSSITYVYRF